MRIPALASLALVVAVGCGGESPPATDSTSQTSRGLLSSVQADSARNQRGVPATGRAPSNAIEVDVSTLGFTRGNPDAPVQIVEMSDYGCGYCRQFHQETWPVIREDFIATGKVRWQFLPFITGMFDNSFSATEAAECALAQNPERFEALSARLWDDQRAWKSASDPDAVLRTLAGEEGVEMDAWDGCMEADDRMQRVRAATELARDLGVRGTPTFFVMGYPPLQGALPTETFVELLNRMHDAALAREATEGGGDGVDGDS